MTLVGCMGGPDGARRDGAVARRAGYGGSVTMGGSLGGDAAAAATAKAHRGSTHPAAALTADFST